MADVKAQSVNLEDFIAAATKGAMRAMAEAAPAAAGVKAELNPQPLPPRAEALRIPPGHIFIGIVAAPPELLQ
jgi:hypothetical protein